MTIQPPVRVRRTYRQHLGASPDRVFPLLCPVREVDWVPGWEPSMVLSTSGAIEPNCVFVTPDAAGESVWIVTRHDPDAYVVEFAKVTPGHTAGCVGIRLEPDGAKRTVAEVTYVYTALGETGEAFVRDFTEETYTDFMQAWERQLNHYLRTGEKLNTKTA